MEHAVHPFVWAITVVALITVIAVDLLVIARRQRAVTTRDALLWIGVYVGLAVLFAAGLFAFAGPVTGSEFVAGYVTEYSLSVDNLFVFVIIMAKFAVPPLAQDKALYIGIVLSLLLRTIFIVAGAAAIAAASWLFYVLGAFLIYTAVRLALEGENDEDDFRENAVLRWLRRILPISPDFDGGRLVTRIDGKRFLTPTVIVIAAIGMANVIFALDSMPAIFGLTTDPYIIFTANALALMGLRQLYFIIGKLLERIVFLNIGLAMILAFIGVKLILEAMHASRIDDIGPVHVPEIGILPSLLFIVGVLTLTTIASLLKSAVDRRRQASVE
ncbi:MAG: TerC/Alx family metal homeostasis membrane protein [Microbacteriaceae bacterium]|nr:TerC/Alx family metal homeostasis membrane protein [Microbacteriaceae bacterium]